MLELGSSLAAFPWQFFLQNKSDTPKISTKAQLQVFPLNGVERVITVLYIPAATGVGEKYVNKIIPMIIYYYYY